MAATAGRTRVFASPLARRLAREADVDLGTVRGSGPGGRVRRQDLEAFLAVRAGGGLGRTDHAGVPSALISIDPTAAPQTLRRDISGGHLETPLPLATAPDRLVRPTLPATFGQRIAQSKSAIPHFYLTVDCIIDRTLEVRDDLNRRGAPIGLALTMEDFILRAVALSMVELPHVNAVWLDDHVGIYHAVDISLVVEGGSGLVAPVIRNADRKGLGEISSESRALMAQAMDGSLMPEQCAGGSFAIFSLGSRGVRTFSAIVPAPQACILAVGAAQRSAVVRNGEIAQATVMSCTLSVDHRVVDGVAAAELLAAVKRRIEDPQLMLL
jgi:pyruvate dehydrogenase E2 component (dihydrolipoamide acetyltransferase)